MDSKELKKVIAKSCPDAYRPYSIILKIGENLQAFNEVIKIFTDKGFVVENFVGDHMCVLARETDGISEAVKVERNTIQIQALRETLLDISTEIAVHCKEVECS